MLLARILWELDASGAGCLEPRPPLLHDAGAKGMRGRWRDHQARPIFVPACNGARLDLGAPSEPNILLITKYLIKRAQGTLMYEAGDTILNLTADLYRHPEARIEAPKALPLSKLEPSCAQNIVDEICCAVANSNARRNK